jgi:uncharacterized protein (DUF302 family)
MQKVLFILTITLFFPTLSAQEFLKFEGIVTLETKGDAPQLVPELTSMLEAKGYTVFSIIDHQENASTVGTELNFSNLIIFGNPEMGSQVLAEFPLMALDLPMKFLIWTNAEGISYITYTRPSYLFRKNTGKDVPEFSAKMDEVLFGLAKEIAK